MIERDYQVLLHIKQHCDDISEFLDDGVDSLNDFENDKMCFNAVAMSLLQIGELTKNFSDEFIEATKEQIPWKEIRGLRNIVAHGYDSLDKETIWTVANNEVSELKDFCLSKINQYKKQNTR